MEKDEYELFCSELGIGVTVQFDPVLYDDDEIEEINEMLIRVLMSWHRRKRMSCSYPKVPGIQVL